MTPIDDKTRMRLVLYGALFLFIVIPLLAFVIFSNREDSIAINNYSTYAKDLPSEQRSSINNALYLTVKLNLVEGEKMIHSSASIREGSANSTYSKDSDVHSGSFIVDLKEIRQSYLASYDWSENKDNPNVSGYPTTVHCLSDSETILYKDFKCKDGSEESGLPLEYQLPHADINGPFEMDFMYKQGDNTAVGISDSTPDGRQEALKWLRSKNIDPTDVIIYYHDMNDQLRRFRYGDE